MAELKDSGQRRQFETGAARDIQDGKGRCDLLPLDVVAPLLEAEELHLISHFKKTGDVSFLYAAIKEFAADNPFYCLDTAILEVSKHFEDGAIKYSENNWMLGIPVHCYIDSAIRHYLKYRRKDEDEPHARAFLWNIICCIWTVENKPELNDYTESR